MHSHHSHSGTYVSHAQDELDDVVARAHELGFSTFCLTEHMPRLNSKFMYPEETEKSMSIEDLQKIFSQYLEHAARLKAEYANRGLDILVGFEVEGIDSAHIDHACNLLPLVDMCVGSVHFVNEIPIDFSQDLWLEARDSLPEKTTRALNFEYYKLQRQVLEKVKPTIVGHFDLIRLFEPQEIDPTTGKHLSQVCIETDWPEVWDLIVGNIVFAKSYGALFELNSAAFRKGWNSPYPKKDVCRAIIEYGDARFCLSDDSHAVSQVGLNYNKLLDFIKFLGLQKIYFLSAQNSSTAINCLSTHNLEKNWSPYSQ
ncbi:hypothetical protein PGUG_05631 [Meyerozyma guilliermondii ATCC 6260]|uniref:Histidinol-phosphatase n=1 Tax=Meyerozyma guilliermondii (strain ATCC 6260 / CBS 566 / DSM 6381 / JCM 1539 / NBRC 10279 / NRRL Y-324) TaxID=294746 RepID=A5DQT0_PICGU|nr:uncharacterized protein PGUG_05631 [Meyerozyma guilliermondii ATCC 6260]EDK41533.2 hypothetical protein PGUG_05631 [Meyerozyma guilliermondii ATCC 6260]